ncbi:MAG: sterol desaturase family protein [Myxococcota bacterium]
MLPHEAFGFPEGLFGRFLFLTVSGFLFYWLLALGSYLLFFRLGKHRFNPDYAADLRTNLNAMKWSFFSLAGGALPVAAIHLLIDRGYGKIYTDVDEHGWGYLIFSVLLLVALSETLVYWAHRFLHWGKAWDKLHKYHHQFDRPTPWAGVAFHPADSFLQGLPHHLAAFLFPLHTDVYVVSVALLTVWAVSIHDRVSIVRWGVINYAGHHTMHHYYDDYNFGQYFTFWDRLMGTYRSPRDPEHWPPEQDRTYAPSS